MKQGVKKKTAASQIPARSPGKEGKAAPRRQAPARRGAKGDSTSPSALAQRFEEGLRRALGEMQELCPGVSPEGVVLIGVSGGRDSVALLHGLVALGWRKLVVCHLNHLLRGEESEGDAAFVKGLAKTLKLKAELAREDVKTFAKVSRQSVETAAREARERFFQKVAEKHGTSHVFLAHHAEDNAETILGNLCRGSGLRGLTGMALAAPSGGGLMKLRPLLEIRRAWVDAWLRERGLAWREDSSNESRAHRRNRLRHEAMPVLAEACGRDVVELMGRTARVLRQEEAFLHESALRFAEEEGLWQADGRLLLTRSLQEVHPAIQARVLRHWLVEVQKIPSVGVHEVEGAMALLRAAAVAKLNLPGGRHLRRKAGRMWVEGEGGRLEV